MQFSKVVRLETEYGPIASTYTYDSMKLHYMIAKQIEC